MIHGIAARWRTAPWGMIGALLLIVGVERTISRHRADVTTETASNYEFTAMMAQGEAARSEILGFGDSLVKYAFQPKVIEARTGRKAYNLAAYGAPPSRDYLMLRRVLDAGGKPSALVVGFQVVHLGATPRFHARRFSEFVTAAEAYHLARSSSDPGLFGLLMLGRYVPSVRARFELRGNVMTALNGHGLHWADAYLAMRRNWYQSRGAHVAPEEPHAPEEPKEARARALELYSGVYSDVSWGASVEEQYIARFLDLAAERKIPVFWIIPPMPPTLHERQNEVRVTELNTTLAQRMSKLYPNLVVVDGRDRGYEASAFCPDDVHLNRQGANVFSRDFGDLIRHRLGNSSPAPAWVALPLYRPGPLIADMEDLVQSILVLRKAWAERR
jgi:hypothetical protein